MSKPLNINIKETPQELKQLLHQQKDGRLRERIQVLYLLTTQPAETALRSAELIGRAYTTVKRWLRSYRQGGINELLKIKSGGDRRCSLPPEVLKTLEERLQQPEGFESYEDIQIWLQETYGIELCYSTVHGIVHTRLKARPKVVRPQSVKRDESQAIDFEKKKLYGSVRWLFFTPVKTPLYVIGVAMKAVLVSKPLHVVA